MTKFWLTTLVSAQPTYEQLHRCVENSVPTVPFTCTVIVPGAGGASDGIAAAHPPRSNMSSDNHDGIEPGFRLEGIASPGAQ